MFWRKRKTDEFEIELGAPQPEAAERRESFRIGADPENPVTVTIGDFEYVAANLSAGGLAIRARELKAGKKYSIRLQLPDGSPVILTEIGVVSVTPQGLCRCKFLRLSVLSQDALHRYILSREKQQIRNTRVRPAVEDESE